MTRMAKIVLVGTLASTLLVGCTSVEERLELRKPAVQLVDVKFTGANLYSATLVFDVEVENFYPLTVPLRGFKYELSSGQATVASGSAEVQINLPAESRRTVSLPATINYVSLLKLLGNVQPGATIPYEARLQVTVETPRLGPIGLPINRTGQLTLPTVSATR